jgi:hypothetical protein
LWASRTTEVAPLPMATFSHTPYFLSKLVVESPPTDLLSESDLRLLPAERCDERLESFGPLASRSLSVNFWPPSSDLMDGGRLGRCCGAGDDGILGDLPDSTFKNPGRSPLVLFARLGVFGGGAALLHSLSEIVGVGELDDTEPRLDLAASDWREGLRMNMLARSPRV